jgi:hypothetical protein
MQRALEALGLRAKLAHTRPGGQLTQTLDRIRK